MKSFSLWIALLLPLAAAQAQTPGNKDEEKPKLPSPLLVKMPAGTRGKVQATRVTALGPQELTSKIRLLFSPDLKSATYLRDEKNLAIAYEWEGNKTSECYVIEGVMFFQPSLKYPDEIYSSGLAGGRGAPNLSQGDFPELSWIDAANYAGTETHRGKKAYVFDRAVGSADQRTKARAHAEQAARELGITDADKIKQLIASEMNDASAGKAWLDADTMLPLEFRDKDFSYLYEFSAAPSAKVEVSEKFQPVVTAHFGPR